MPLLSDRCARDGDEMQKEGRSVRTWKVCWFAVSGARHLGMRGGYGSAVDLKKAQAWCKDDARWEGKPKTGKSRSDGIRLGSSGDAGLSLTEVKFKGGECQAREEELLLSRGTPSR